MKDLQTQLHDAIDFIDALQKNVQQIAREDEHDADQVTDGSDDILRGRVELAYIIDEKIQDWKEESFKEEEL